MVRRNRPYARRVAVAASIAVAAGFLAQPGPSGADVTAVSGSAFGAQGTVAFMGGAPTNYGPIPAVTLPSTGGNESATAPSIEFGLFLTAGQTDVSTAGTTGAGGSATSTATVQNLNVGETTVTTLSSTCTASEAGLSGSTTVTGGRVPTQDPNPNVDGDEVYTDVPSTPAANQTYNGVLPGVPTDYYRVVFNEQVVTENSITVNAAHFYLGENPPAQNGPFARGEFIVGQSHCDIVPTGGTTSTTQGTGGTTTTTQGTGGTTTTTQGAGGTTTTLGTGGTTTTLGTGVTPTPGPVFGSINVSELIRQIVCPILQQLLADPFLGPIIRPFIEPFLVAFGCTA